MTYTVHIIGAGPAGCATALALNNKTNQLDIPINISLVSDVDNGLAHIGETIPPAANEYLNQLGVSSLLNEGHLQCPGSISVWGDKTPGYNDFLFTPTGKGYHLHRKKFNQQLITKCENAGIELINNTKFKGIVPTETGVNLLLRSNHSDTNNPSTEVELNTQFIVDATGINATVARALDVTRNEYDSVISLCAFYDTPLLKDSNARTIISTSEIGWWYASQLPNQRAIISLCTDAKTLKQEKLNQPDIWLQHFSKTDWFYQQCKDQFQCPFGPPKPLHPRVSPSAILSNCVGQRWLAVGDAASSYDSMTSAGITKALNHGILAGKAIATTLANDDSPALKKYQQSVFNDFNQYLRLHQILYTKEQRYVDSGFWKRRQLLPA